MSPSSIAATAGSLPRADLSGLFALQKPDLQHSCTDTQHDPLICPHPCDPAARFHIGRCLHVLSAENLNSLPHCPIACSIRCLRASGSEDGPVLDCLICGGPAEAAYNFYPLSQQFLDFIVYARLYVERVQDLELGDRACVEIVDRLSARYDKFLRNPQVPRLVRVHCRRVKLYGAVTNHSFRTLQHLYAWARIQLRDHYENVVCENLIWSPEPPTERQAQEYFQLARLFPDEADTIYSPKYHEGETPCSQEAAEEAAEEAADILRSFDGHPGFEGVNADPSHEAFLEDIIRNQCTAPRLQRHLAEPNPDLIALTVDSMLDKGKLNKKTPEWSQYQAARRYIAGSVAKLLKGYATEHNLEPQHALKTLQVALTVETRSAALSMDYELSCWRLRRHEELRDVRRLLAKKKALNAAIHRLMDNSGGYWDAKWLAKRMKHYIYPGDEIPLLTAQEQANLRIADGSISKNVLQLIYDEMTQGGLKTIAPILAVLQENAAAGSTFFLLDNKSNDKVVSALEILRSYEDLCEASLRNFGSAATTTFTVLLDRLRHKDGKCYGLESEHAKTITGHVETVFLRRLTRTQPGAWNDWCEGEMLNFDGSPLGLADFFLPSPRLGHGAELRPSNAAVLAVARRVVSDADKIRTQMRERDRDITHTVLGVSVLYLRDEESASSPAAVVPFDVDSDEDFPPLEKLVPSSIPLSSDDEEGVTASQTSTHCMRASSPTASLESDISSFDSAEFDLSFCALFAQDEDEGRAMDIE